MMLSGYIFLLYIPNNVMIYVKNNLKHKQKKKMNLALFMLVLFTQADFKLFEGNECITTFISFICLNIYQKIFLF